MSSADNFELFDGEGIFAANRRQILDQSKQSSCKNCIKWAKADPEADAFTWDSSSTLCTKLRGLHRKNNVFAVLTDPIVGSNGQIVRKPLSLITNQTEFPLSNEHHHIKFMDYQPTPCKCRQKAATVTGTRFVAYDNKTKQCIGVSKSDKLTHVTMGIRRGKLLTQKQPSSVLQPQQSAQMPAAALFAPPTFATAIPHPHLPTWAMSKPVERPPPPPQPGRPCLPCAAAAQAQAQAQAASNGASSTSVSSSSSKPTNEMGTFWMCLLLFLGFILLCALLWKLLSWVFRQPKAEPPSNDELWREEQAIEQKQEQQQIQLDQLQSVGVPSRRDEDDMQQEAEAPPEPPLPRFSRSNRTTTNRSLPPTPLAAPSRSSYTTFGRSLIDPDTQYPDSL